MSIFKDIELVNGYISESTGILTGIGSTVFSQGTNYISPKQTTISGSNNYYFSYYNTPTTTGITTGSAYNIYIDGAPSGTISNSYALYINSGKTYIGESLQIPNSAANGHVLASDSLGNAAWIASSEVVSFNNGTASIPSIYFKNDIGTNTGFYRIAEDTIGVTTGGLLRLSIGNTVSSFTTGQTVNIGTSGTTSPLNIFGLITGSNGLTISSGTSSLRAVTSTTLTASGLITGNAGLTITSGTSSLRAVTTTTLTSSGLITANLGLTVTTGQTLNIGTSGTTSPLNVYGLITGLNGLTITNGISSLQAVTATTIIASGLITGNAGLTITSGISSLRAVTTTTLTASGLITANAGLTVTNGQTTNIGTSGITSILNVYALTDIYGSTAFNGIGNITNTNATVYVAPSSTAVSGANNYYFSYFDTPTTTGTTTGSAYTMYIDGAPTGNITNPYSLYVNSGRTYLGGPIRIPTNAAVNRVLTSDASGNANWGLASTAHFTVSDSTARSFSSTVLTDLPLMTLTPVAGTYIAIFSGTIVLSNNSRVFSSAFAKNGVTITDSISQVTYGNTPQNISRFYVITCNGTDVITLQWAVSSNSVSCPADSLRTFLVLSIV